MFVLCQQFVVRDFHWCSRVCGSSVWPRVLSVEPGIQHPLQDRWKQVLNPPLCLIKQMQFEPLNVTPSPPSAPHVSLRQELKQKSSAMEGVVPQMLHSQCVLGTLRTCDHVLILTPAHSSFATHVQPLKFWGTTQPSSLTYALHCFAQSQYSQSGVV